MNEAFKKIIENYKPSRISIEDLMTVHKMPENRADGTETEDERKKLQYSKEEIANERKHLEALEKHIKRVGFDPDAKTFILGECGDMKGVLFLVDGQHMRAIVKRLVGTRYIPSDIMLKYTINHYKSYSDMVDALSTINNGKPMSNPQLSRAKGFHDGKCDEGYTRFMNAEEKYDGVFNRPSMIRLCMFGQSNGVNIFQKPISEYYDNIIKAYESLIKLSETEIGDASLTDVIKGGQHGIASMRDLYNKMFTTAVEDGSMDKKHAIELAQEACETLNKGIMGVFSTPTKKLSAVQLKRMFGYTQVELKNAIEEKTRCGYIKFYKTKNKNPLVTSLIDEALYRWYKMGNKKA